jgi:hypothetical protein
MVNPTSAVAIQHLLDMASAEARAFLLLVKEVVKEVNQSCQCGATVYGALRIVTEFGSCTAMRYEARLGLRKPLEALQ